MAVIYRTTGAWGSGKGSNLTPAEVDGNFYDHEGRIDALETSPPTANEIVDISVESNALVVTMADDTAYGPFSLPTAAFNWRGDWLGSISYSVNDVVYAQGYGVYLVLYAHTSPVAFDPDHIASGYTCYDQIMADIETPVNRSVADVSESGITLVAAHRGYYLRFTASQSGNIEVTLDPESVTNFDIGTEIHFRQSSGTPVELVFDSSITVNAKAGCDYTTVEEGSVVTLVKVGADEWDYFGDHGTVSV